jgi:hypothetical protein
LRYYYIIFLDKLKKTKTKISVRVVDVSKNIYVEYRSEALKHRAALSVLPMNENGILDTLFSVCNRS